MKFSGSIRVGLPTPLSPSGARGRRIVLPVSVARNRIHTLVGCPLTVAHRGVEVGRITEAWIDGMRMRFAGKMSCASDDPATVFRGMRFSWEAEHCHIANYAARRVWRVRRIERFTAMALVTRPASRSSKLKVYE